MSVTVKGKRWKILHSLWIGWTFTLGFFNWVAFFYIGYRAKQKKWLLWGLFYSIPFVLAMGFGIGTGGEGTGLRWLGNLNVALTVLMGIMSIFHAFKVRKEYLVRLELTQDQGRTNDSLLKQRIATEGQNNSQELPLAPSRETAKLADAPTSSTLDHKVQSAPPTSETESASAAVPEQAMRRTSLGTNAESIVPLVS